MNDIMDVDLFNIPPLKIPGIFMQKVTTHVVNGFSKFSFNYDILKDRDKESLTSIEKKYIIFIEELIEHISIGSCISKDKIKIYDLFFSVLEKPIEVR